MDSGPYSLCPSRQLGSGFPQIEPPRITVEAPSWLIPAWQTQKLPKPQWANLLEHGPSTWPLNSWRNKLHALSRGLCKAMCKGAWTQGGVKNGGQLMQSASHRWEANKGDMDWAFLGKKQKLCEQQLYREFNWIWGENRWQNDNCDHVAMKHPKVRQLGCESRKVYELFRQVISFLFQLLYFSFLEFFPQICPFSNSFILGLWLLFLSPCLEMFFVFT